MTADPTRAREAGPTPLVTGMQFLLGGDIKAEIRIIGGAPKPEHIDTLSAYLKVTHAALAGPDERGET